MAEFNTDTNLPCPPEIEDYEFKETGTVNEPAECVLGTFYSTDFPPFQ